MNKIVLAALVIGIVGLLVVGSIGLVKAGPDKTTQISCSSCQGKCNAEQNCGSPTCGAVSGTGTCGCSTK